MGKAQIEISKILFENKPDLMIVLGDRYEILSAVTAALLLNIPVAHIHGGEETQGAFDNSIRHAITKMSQLHFVATKKSRTRVMQMGESPEKVFNFGGLGVDAIGSTDFQSRDKLENLIGQKFGERNLLVTFHPETISEKYPVEQIQHFRIILRIHLLHHFVAFLTDDVLVAIHVTGYCHINFSRKSHMKRIQHKHEEFLDVVLRVLRE
jgi:GDP/UDP-N,N'-diacetylbacillosamine 2-epimerase (hydrolysing)